MSLNVVGAEEANLRSNINIITTWTNVGAKVHH